MNKSLINSTSNINNGQSKTKFQLLTFHQSLNIFLFGYNLSVVNKLQSYMILLFNISDNDKDYQQGFINGSYFASMAVGSIIGQFISNKFGRQKCTQITGMIYIISSVFCIFNIFYLLIIGRILVGLSAGISLFNTNKLINETSPIQLRGSMNMIMSMNIGFGILISYLIVIPIPNFGLTLDNKFVYWQYKIIFLFNAIIIIYQFIMISYVFRIESPLYLYKSDKTERCLDELEKLYGTKRAEEYFQQQKCQNIEKDQQLCTNFNKKLIKNTLFCIILGLLQPMSGMNALFSQSMIVFGKIGGKNSSEIATIILGIINILNNLVPFILLDKLGRRVLLLTSQLCLALVCCLISISYRFNSPDIIIIILILLFNVSFSIGYGSLIFVQTAETLNSYGMSLIVFILNIVNFVLLLFFAKMINSNFGYFGTFLLLAGCNLISFVITYIFMIETKNLTLNEIKLIIENKLDAKKINEQRTHLNKDLFEINE